MSPTHQAPSTRSKQVLVLLTVLFAALVLGGISAYSEVRAPDLANTLTPEALPLTPPTEELERESERILARAMEDSADLARVLADHVDARAEYRAVTDRPVQGERYVTLEPGHSLQALRYRWSLTTRQLEELNPELDWDNLEPGTEILVYRPTDEPTISRLRPNRGNLLNAELMPEGDGWVLRRPFLSFGATQTIDAIIDSVREVELHHPGGQDLMVADISRREGGRFSPHRSHQSGRDVDLTYYRTEKGPARFTTTRPRELDAARTWTLIRTMLLQHDVVYIFMDRQLQIALYEHAESIGEHPAFLSDIFQYGPRRHHNNSAPIRVAPGHRDHFHVRFGCSENDVRCGHAR
ncbi:MAG: penicillin-insensitive murein endopeptidase [Myxococcales bacterium]|nr:penicillin-insensitive murein endopeptidase [Myxococcales bacterium]